MRINLISVQSGHHYPKKGSIHSWRKREIRDWFIAIVITYNLDLDNLLAERALPTQVHFKLFVGAHLKQINDNFLSIIYKRKIIFIKLAKRIV